MEAEAIRDALLAASGRLDRTLYGMSIPAYREKEDAYRRLFQRPARRARPAQHLHQGDADGGPEIPGARSTSPAARSRRAAAT